MDKSNREITRVVFCFVVMILMLLILPGFASAYGDTVNSIYSQMGWSFHGESLQLQLQG